MAESRCEKELQILQEISTAITISDSLHSITNLILDLALEYTFAEKGSLMLLNEEGELSIFSARGIEYNQSISYRRQLGEGIAGSVAQARTPILVAANSIDEWLHNGKNPRYKTNSFISCPVISKNRTLGVININDKQDGTDFSDEDFSFVRILASQAAITIENALLMNQLKQQTSEMEEINRKLIDSNLAKTDFLIRMSNDLRNPLNSITGSVFYLQQTNALEKSEYKEFLDIISNETEQVASIVEKLLGFLSLDQDLKTLSKSSINLSDIINSVISSKTINNIFIKKNIKITFNKEGVISTVAGERLNFIEFFSNLLEAFAFNLERHDEIDISLYNNGSVKMCIMLSNVMPERVLNQIHDPNLIFQSKQSEDRLRLYIACKIAEHHGWDVEARNLDSAFIITFTLPKTSRHKVQALIENSLDVCLEFIAEILDLNICSIMLSDDFRNELTIKSARGLDSDIIRRTRVRYGERIAGWVAQSGEPLLIQDIEDDNRFQKKNISQYNTKSLVSLPLKIGTKVVGVLNLNNKRTGAAFTHKDLYIARAFGDRITHFMEKVYSGTYTEHDVQHLLTTLQNLTVAARKYQQKKSIIPDVMLKMLEQLKLSDDETKDSLYASLIYDLGLMLFDDNVLSKSNLSQAEIDTIKVHPHTTIGLLNSFEFAEPVKKAILYHHERYDGTGYPARLQGNDIPFTARILAVVDTYCAMISDRPYRKAFTQEEALDEVKRGAGSKYDPYVVATLSHVLNAATA